MIQTPAPPPDDRRNKECHENLNHAPGTAARYPVGFDSRVGDVVCIGADAEQDELHRFSAGNSR